MRKVIRFTDLDCEVTLSNEKETEHQYFSVGHERGASFDDISLEIDLTDFCSMSEQTLQNFQTWMIKNAETYMRAAIQKRDEEEAANEVKRQEKFAAMREEKKVRKNKEGFVYLVSADNGFCKIGKTKNVDARIHEFGIKIPMKTQLVHSFRSLRYDQAEVELHERFADKRDHGEWFALTQEDIDFICSIQDNQL